MSPGASTLSHEATPGGITPSGEAQPSVGRKRKENEAMRVIVLRSRPKRLWDTALVAPYPVPPRARRGSG